MANYHCMRNHAYLLSITLGILFSSSACNQTQSPRMTTQKTVTVGNTIATKKCSEREHSASSYFKDVASKKEVALKSN